MLLFDTNILIDTLAGDVRAKTLLANNRPASISLVSWIEVMAGTEPREELAVRAFLNGLEIAPVTQSIAERAAAIRRARKSLKLPDAIILASAQVSGRTLVTRNTKDFPVGSAGVWTPYQP